eukprot:scaffold21329_cov62-Phaeocystis_antarctica.AAC.7
MASHCVHRPSSSSVGGRYAPTGITQKPFGSTCDSAWCGQPGQPHGPQQFCPGSHALMQVWLPPACNVFRSCTQQPRLSSSAPSSATSSATGALRAAGVATVTSDRRKGIPTGPPLDCALSLGSNSAPPAERSAFASLTLTVSCLSSALSISCASSSASSWYPRSAARGSGFASSSERGS